MGFLTVFAVGVVMHRALIPNYDGLARFSQSLHRELDLACRPGDRVVVILDDDQYWTDLWYLARLGDRVAYVRRGDRPPAAARLWVLTTHLTPDQPGHDATIRSLTPPGYGPGHTSWCAAQPEFHPRRHGERKLWWYGVTCLVPPGDDHPPPVISTLP